MTARGIFILFFFFFFKDPKSTVHTDNIKYIFTTTYLYFMNKMWVVFAHAKLGGCQGVAMLIYFGLLLSVFWLVAKGFRVVVWGLLGCCKFSWWLPADLQNWLHYANSNEWSSGESLTLHACLQRIHPQEISLGLMSWQI